MAHLVEGWSPSGRQWCSQMSLGIRKAQCEPRERHSASQLGMDSRTPDSTVSCPVWTPGQHCQMWDSASLSLLSRVSSETDTT